MAPLMALRAAQRERMMGYAESDNDSMYDYSSDESSAEDPQVELTKSEETFGEALYSADSDEDADAAVSMMNLTMVNADKKKFGANIVVLDTGNSMNVVNGKEWFPRIKKLDKKIGVVIANGDTSYVTHMEVMLGQN
jgi:hypothetical protein